MPIKLISPCEASIRLLLLVSKKEIEVLTILYTYAEVSEMAEQLGISVHTFNHHLYNVHLKFECPSTRKLLRKLEADGLMIRKTREEMDREISEEQTD